MPHLCEIAVELVASLGREYSRGIGAIVVQRARLCGAARVCLRRCLCVPNAIRVSVRCASRSGSGHARRGPRMTVRVLAVLAVRFAEVLSYLDKLKPQCETKVMSANGALVVPSSLGVGWSG